MADSPTKLRRKIGSAADLQSVVRAMKAQAAASIGQYAQSVAALGDYASNVELGLSACLRQIPFTAVGSARVPAAGNRPIRAVVFGSDQGLVGRFNDTLFEYAQQVLATQHPGAQVWAVGDRMQASLADGGIAPQGTFALPATVRAITPLVAEILVTVVDATALALEPGSMFELHLFYNRPTTGAAYVPVSQQLLPLDGAWRRELSRRPWPTHLPAEVLGSLNETMRCLISEYLFVSIFRASAESLASENASRLAAMERADQNIDRMLLALHEHFHRLRQSKIDDELSDVISGFESLRSPRGSVRP